MGSEHPDWLPLDWKVSVKTGSFGRKDKYYIHPSTGLTFNSKPQVLRYLSSQNSSNPKVMNKMNIKNTVAEKLPPGWIKEIRTKRIKGKTRRDPYYIDPVSGRHFRSMQEVFRYLKTNDSGKAESKTDNKGHKSTDLVENSQPSSAEAKRQRLIGKGEEKNLANQESIKSGPDAAAASPKKLEKPIMGEKHRKDDSIVEKFQYKLPQENFEKQRNGGRRLSMRLANNKLKDDAKEYSLQSGSETAAENMNISESKGVEHREKENSNTVETIHHENPTPRNKTKSTKRKWMNNAPRRTSKRLACLEVDQSVEVKTGDKDGALSRLSSDKVVDSTKNASESGQSNEPKAVKSCTTDSDKQHRVENATNDKQKDAIIDETLPCEEQKSVGVVNQDLGSSLKDLFMDPCIEFAIKTLTGAIPIEEVKSNPVSSSSNQTSGCSSGDIWSDPCFEFAVKTLTGEIPAENGLQVEIRYEKPGSSTGDSVSLSNNSFTQSAAATKSCPPFAQSPT